MGLRSFAIIVSASHILPAMVRSGCVSDATPIRKCQSAQLPAEVMPAISDLHFEADSLSLQDEKHANLRNSRTQIEKRISSPARECHHHGDRPGKHFRSVDRQHSNAVVFPDDVKLLRWKPPDSASINPSSGAAKGARRGEEQPRVARTHPTDVLPPVFQVASGTPVSDVRGRLIHRAPLDDPGHFPIKVGRACSRSSRPY
jgi:hypothetical protein